MTETSTKDANQDMFETPGQVLRLEREKQELTSEDIAKRTHLDIKIIESIEIDDADNLPSAIYVRGYLRSYAKIVGADADHIIELYNSDSPAAEPEILPEVKPPSQVSSNDKPVKAFTYLITLGLVLLLLIWYQSNFVVDNRAVGQADTVTNINGVDVDYDIINHPESFDLNANDSEEEVVTEEENDTAALIETVDMTEQMNQEGLQLSENITPLNNTNDNLVSTVRGQGSDSLELNVKTDSWTEVRDATDTRLFHDLAIAGETYTLKGTAPFSVLLGFSEGVTVKFNGELFDAEPYSKNGVARFILSE